MDALIKDLRYLIADKSKLLLRVKSPQDLLASLMELNEFIEMHEVKDRVAGQVKYFLLKPYSSSPHMLHTAIYGPPGVGKTKLGIALAKIWQSLGILKQPMRVSFMHPLLEMPAIKKKNEKLTRTLQRVKGDVDKCVTKRHHRRDLYLYLERMQEDLKEFTDDNGNEPQGQRVEPPFIVASRGDLVSNHVGETTLKTRAFLEANRGRVVFIDEAYILINSERDSFGMEALTELNKYMSEKPDELIVILAGYRDLMQKYIFSSEMGQPGLERRCAWTFDIKGYSSEGLARIFLAQLNKNGWSLDSAINLEAFFEREKKHFQAYGGDTEKLCFYTKQVYAESLFHQVALGGEKNSLMITETILREALLLLTNNKALKSENQEMDEWTRSRIYM